MEPSTLVDVLIKNGSMAVLAAVLFYLHITSLKAFREEIKAEREMCRKDHEKIMDALRSYTKGVHAVIKNINNKQN